ncbi:MAG: hypothetical protein V1709_01520 [Planctomycetota bacterium]
MRLFFYSITLVLLIYVLPTSLISEQTTKSSSNSTTIQSEKPIKNLPETAKNDESWYVILLKGEKIGYMNTSFSELNNTSQKNSQVQKLYKFLREISFIKPSFLPYQKLTEEIQVNVDSLDFQSLNLKLLLIDNREFILKGIKDENKVKFSITVQTVSSTNEPIPETSNQEFTPKENFYSEQLLGTALIENNWSVNQSYPLRFISYYNSSNFFTNAHLMVKEKTSQTIMGTPTEGYLCSLIILDPAASVKEIEYFIGLNGILLKQTIGDINIIKVTKEEFANKVNNNKPIFERRGRPDPFTIKLTPVIKKSSPNTTSLQQPPTLPPDIQLLTLLKQAEDQLKLMKDIYDKTPEEERDKLLSAPYQKILDIYEQINCTDNNTAKEKMASIRDEAEKLFAGAEKIYAEARYIKNESQKDFELRNFKDIPKNLSKISELAERKEVKDTEYLPEILKLVDEMKELSRRAKIIEEFFSKQPVVNGIIYYIKPEEVKLPPLIIYFLGAEISLPISYFKHIPASTVIINNKTYEESNTILDNLVIKKIMRNSITFNYKNEEITIEYKSK